MRKSLTYKILAAVLALSAANRAVPADVSAGYEENECYYVTADGETVSKDYTVVYGNGHSFTINGCTIKSKVFGAGNDNQDYDKDASGGNVTINGNANVSYLVYGGRSGKGEAYNNTVNISGGSVGGSEGAVYGGRSISGNAHHNTVNISGGSVGGSEGAVYGGRSISGNAHHNTVNISDGSVTSYVFGGNSDGGTAHHNTVNISGGSVRGEVYGGDSYCVQAHHNIVNISGGSVTGEVRGGASYSGSADSNIVNISGGSVTNDVYGGYVAQGIANNNEIIVSGSAVIENAKLYGRNDEASGTGNTLTIDGWSGSTQSLKNFSDINFNNVNWKNGETVLKITNGSEGNLTNTNINLNSIAGGSSIKAGDKMTFIASNTNLSDEVNYKVNDNFTAGVALEGTGTTSVDNEGKVSFTVNNLKASSQAVSAAQTRAASAAFVNQGTDLISDSLDTISRDDNYGVKTFAAVHGNRSKYDVADDIKINGWSTIVGVGNADKFDNGSEFSWGVFYENGSGNYRTYNSFNNEFFRGDGSMVYNGGGIAARYENKNGVYTEGSLRTGMLKNELDNAMRDVNGSYGYETESAYYGAHIGVGKIISLSDSSDLDVYGKFFHTYTEGDSVTIAEDKFDFDSITSDRLRVGARITSNKENKFSTYYGLAYEYEFNGDADMTAQGLRADTQSLQGSSVMAELGFNYQPTSDSPWSFDLNMRGYTGERQGSSFNVQATYTF